MMGAWSSLDLFVFLNALDSPGKKLGKAEVAV